MAENIYITFMRHGRSLADDEEVHEGCFDSPMTEIGKAQVRNRAEGWLKEGITFDSIITSTLMRARENAQIVGSILDVPVEPDPDWMEFDNGPLAGLPLDVAEQRYPQPDFRNSYEPFWGSGESDWEFYCRAAHDCQRRSDD